MLSSHSGSLSSPSLLTSPNGHLSSCPPGPLASSQSGTLATALLDEAAPPQPSWKKRIAVGSLIVVVIGAAAALGTLLGSTAAQMGESAATPVPAREAAAEPEATATVVPSAEPSAASAEPSAANAPSAESAEPTASGAPSPPPAWKPPLEPRPRGEEPWDPFDSRK
jgi:hypothetical protein